MRRFIPLLFAFLFGCTIPAVPIGGDGGPTTLTTPPTTIPATTTTRLATSTTTTTVASGGDETAALTAYILGTAKPVINRAWTVNGTVNLPGVTNKTITGTAGGMIRRTVTPASTSVPILSFTGASNVTLTNVIVQGEVPCTEVDPLLEAFGVISTAVTYVPAVEHQHAVQITNSTGITLNGDTFDDVHGDALYLDGVTHLTATNLTARCAGRNSVSTVNSADTTFTGGMFGNAGLFGIDLEPNPAAAVTAFTMTDPTIGYSRTNWLSSAGPNNSCHVDATITRPHLAAQMWGWYAKPCTPPINLTVTGCTSDGNQPTCVEER